MTARPLPVDECLRCERDRPIRCRGLCQACLNRSRHDGTVTDYGYVKTDRVRDYAQLRTAGYRVAAAGARVGVSGRTAQRYEKELAAAGQAPWRDRADERWRREKAGWPARQASQVAA